MKEFSSAERKIIDAAREGTLADFRKDGERRQRMPNIDAEFLARLWAGWIDGCLVHPRGLRLAGIRIKGDVDVHSNPHRDGFGTLAYIELIDCRLDGLLNLTSCSVKGARFEGCDFGVGRSPNVKTYDQSIEATSARFEENVVFTKCRFPASLELTGIRVGQDFEMSECGVDHALSLGSAKIGANARFEKSHFAGGGEIDGTPFYFSIICQNAEVGIEMQVNRCRFDRFAGLHYVTADSFWITNSRFRSGDGFQCALSLTSSCAARSVRVERCHLEGSLKAGGLKSESDVFLTQLILEDDHGPGCVILNQAKAADRFVVERVKASGGIGLRATRCEGSVLLAHCRIGSYLGRGLALDAHGLQAGETTIHNCRIAGPVLLDAARIEGPFKIARTAILQETCFGKKGFAFTDICPDHANRFDANESEISGYFSIEFCLVVGCTEFARMKAAPGAQLFGSVFLSGKQQTSLGLQRFATQGHIFLRACHIAHGLDLYSAKPAQVDIEGCTIGYCDRPGSAPFSIWADDCEIERDLWIRGFNYGETSLFGQIAGAVQFNHAKIGGDFIVFSMALEISQVGRDAGYGAALILAKAHVGGDVSIGYRTRRTNARYIGLSPPSITGALILDDARIGGDVVINEATLTAVGEVRRPQAHFNAEERVGLRKRGVALSLRDAKVGGELYIGRPATTQIERGAMLGGIVDLRNASVNLIADGGGDRWTQAGLQPGHLLLDGVGFRDLDDVGEDRGSDSNRADDPAARRLRWLDLQFPSREATPDTFVPQPYEQLASIFAAEGNERARRQVLVAKRNLQRKHGRLGRLDRVMQWVLMVVSEYGYQPGRALSWTLGFVLFGTAATMALEAADAFILSTVDGQPKAEFSAFVYALDSAIPIIDLNQDSGWTIDPGALPPWLPIEAVLVTKALYEIIGMLLVSITILTLTGTLREKE